MLLVVRHRSLGTRKVGAEDQRRTYTNQSMAQRRETSATGASMAVRTISMRTRAAEGTEAEAMEAAVEVSLKIHFRLINY